MTLASNLYKDCVKQDKLANEVRDDGLDIPTGKKPRAEGKHWRFIPNEDTVEVPSMEQWHLFVNLKSFPTFEGEAEEFKAESLNHIEQNHDKLMSLK